MNSHRIHLKGPWEYEWMSAARATARSEAAGRVKLPADWRALFGEHGGSVRFRRRFHKPTNLEPHEQVSIVFEGIGGSGRVWLNDHPLGAFTDAKPSLSYEVTSLLDSSNVLTVELSYDPGHSGSRLGGLWGPVAMEIRSQPPHAT